MSYELLEICYFKLIFYHNIFWSHISLYVKENLDTLCLLSIWRIYEVWMLLNAIFVQLWLHSANQCSTTITRSVEWRAMMISYVMMMMTILIRMLTRNELLKKMSEEVLFTKKKKTTKNYFLKKSFKRYYGWKIF